ncbi:MAG TPA: carboxypeptidase regulatory-like domain-containing protein [Candidatus Udaeobacter sp.]|nr:carboxypeptidase regulatory-like domain-containing protein [Candidatus Udaeobacter sp.]
MHAKAWTGLVLTLATLGFGCGGGGGQKQEAATGHESGADAPAATPPAGEAAPAAAGGTGSIAGKIMLTGEAPKATPIKMDADPYCKSQHEQSATSESVVTNPDGSLRNVFIYVKSGLPAGQTYAAPTEPATIDQHGCTYHPHVQGIMVGQPLTILNSDGTLHNIHSLAKNSKQFNLGMPTKGMKLTQKFTGEEVMVRVKCDVHPWMECWMGVLNHPFYSVSGDNGAFEIKNLPPGTYEVEAWHEKFGVQTQSVTVTAGQPATVSFTFAPSA